MQDPKVLLLPGWQNSGAAHCQSRWELLYGDLPVEQHEWMHTLRGDWIARLEEVLLEQTAPVILVAHSLGWMLTAAWARHSRNTHLVQGALLVAPGDPDGDELEGVLRSWIPIVTQKLPFASMLLGSHNDLYCTFARARSVADAWGSEFIDCGACGHINGDSGLGDWPEGRALLGNLGLPTAGD